MSSGQSTPGLSSSAALIDLDGRYTPIRKIGAGTFGEVWLVSVNNLSSSKSRQKQYVVKRINLTRSSHPPSQKDIENAQHEANLLSTLKHPNIVAYIETFRSKDGLLNLVMGYCEGGDLYTKLRDIESKGEVLIEDQIIEWFIQICMALQYLHDKNILHRDLKTQNIFLTKFDLIKVGDLGIARALQSKGELATTMVGTPYYMSPEILSHQPYGPKSDIWALGCCIYEMTAFEFAFNAADIHSLFMKVIDGQIPKMPKKYSESLTSMITSMLKKKPNDRPTATELLQSPYLQKSIRKFLDKMKTKNPNTIHDKTHSKLDLASSTSPSNLRMLPSNAQSALSNSRSSSSSSSPNRLSPSVEPLKSNEQLNSSKRTHHRHHEHHADSSSVQTKQHQQLLSSDEQDTLFFRQSYQSTSQPITNFESSRKQERKNSVDFKISLSQSSSDLETRKSYDSNQGSVSEARLRRRQKQQSSNNELSTPIKSWNVTTPYPLHQFPFQDCQAEETEKNQEGVEDINDLVVRLTHTLELPAANASRMKKLPYPTYDMFQPRIENGHDQNSLRTSDDRSTSGSLNGSNHIYRRYQQLQEYCLYEIDENKLRRVLKKIDSDDEAKIMQAMIDELGEYLFKKYSKEIFLLKFYDDLI